MKEKKCVPKNANHVGGALKSALGGKNLIVFWVSQSSTSTKYPHLLYDIYPGSELG